MKLLLISRQSDGRLLRASWTGIALRTALLVDLIFDGGLHDDLQGFSVSTMPVGFEPADDLLAAIARAPARSLATWIGRGPSVRKALAEQWVRDGVLSRKPGRFHRHARYGLTPEPSWSEATAQSEIERLKQIAQSPSGADPADACLAALAVLGGIIPYEVRPSADLIRRCGAAAWLIQATDALILDSEMRSVQAGGG